MAETKSQKNGGLTRYRENSLAETREKLSAALKSVTNQSNKITPTLVARIAGVDRATLYRFHKEILIEIQKNNSSHTKNQPTKKTSISNEILLAEYRKLVVQAQVEVEALAKINYGLDQKIRELEEVLRIRNRQIQLSKEAVISSSKVHSISQENKKF